MSVTSDVSVMQVVFVVMGVADVVARFEELLWLVLPLFQFVELMLPQRSLAYEGILLGLHLRNLVWSDLLLEMLIFLEVEVVLGRN